MVVASGKRSKAQRKKTVKKSLGRPPKTVNKPPIKSRPSIKGRSFFLAFKAFKENQNLLHVENLPDDLAELIQYLVFRTIEDGEQVGYLYASKENVEDTRVLRVFSEYLSELRVQKGTIDKAERYNFLDINDGNFTLRIGIPPRFEEYSYRYTYIHRDGSTCFCSRDVSTATQPPPQPPPQPQPNRYTFLTTLSPLPSTHNHLHLSTPSTA